MLTGTANLHGNLVCECIEKISPHEVHVTAVGNHPVVAAPTVDLDLDL